MSAVEEQVDEQIEVTQTAEDFFGIDVMEIPIPPPEVHQGVVTGVELVRLDNEKQSTKIAVHVASQNTPALLQSLDIWLPLPFVEDIHVKATDIADQKKREQFGRQVSNSQKSATLQKLWAQALAEPGRTLAELGLEKPTTIEEYTDALGKALNGLEVLFLYAPDRSPQPGFEDKQRVQGIYPRSDQDQPKKFKAYDPETKKGVVRMWEQ